MSRATEREYCPTCQHIIAKDRVNLSSLEFRRRVSRITDLDDVDSSKIRLYQYIKSSYKVKDFADQFLSDLEDKLDSEDADLNDIKLWLLSFINNEDRSFPPRELNLYRFLISEYSAINMPFAEFYDCYVHWNDNPISKNMVSRALSAFGLKPVMKKIMVEGKMKCTIMVCATEEELAKLCQKNGFNLIKP
jgi:hypothetical protein